MSNRLLVATRKGLLDYQFNAGEWQLVQRSFPGQPVTATLRNPYNGHLFAALNMGHFGVKLHRSADDGVTWTEIHCPSYADVQGEEKPSLQQIWIMECDQQGTLWAGTNPGGLFKSSDNGDSWELNRNLWDNPLRKEMMGGGFDTAGIHSICLDPVRAGYMALAVSCGGVWLSEDYGQTWHISTKGLIADYMPPDQAENPAAQDVHRMVQCPAQPDHFWIQHHNGIFYSNDRCANWQRIYAQPSSFGFAVVVHPHIPQQAWFVPGVKDEFRYPVDGRFVVSHTSDSGASFTVLNKGLPTQESFDLVYRHCLDIDASGKRLAMASTTGNMWVTEDGGEAWNCISNYLPPVYAMRFI